MKVTACFLLLLLFFGFSQATHAQHWVPMSPISGGAVQSVGTTPNGDIYLTTQFSLLHSSNNGLTWGTLLSEDDGIDHFFRIRITHDGSLLLFVSPHKSNANRVILRSSDKGVSWDTVIKHISYFHCNVLPTGMITAILDNNQVYRSIDNGKTMHQWNIDAPITPKKIFGDKKGIIYILGYNNSSRIDEIYRSTNGGSSWSKIINPPLKINDLMNILPLNDTTVVAIHYTSKPYISKDNGRTWKQIITPEPGNHYQIYSATLDSSGQILTTAYGISNNGDSIFSVPRSGDYWSAISNESASSINGRSIFPMKYGALVIDKNAINELFPSHLTFDAGKIVSLGFGKGSLMAFSDNSYEDGTPEINIKYSNDRGGSWKFSSTNAGFGDTHPFIATDSNQIKWVLINHELYKHSGTTFYMGKIFDFGTTTFTSMTVGANNTFFLTSNNEGFYRSTDNGKNWDQLTYGLTTKQLYSSSWYEGHLFLGGRGTLYHSTDNGDSWTTIETPFLGATTLITTQLASNNTLFIAVDSLGIYKTTNLGGVWQLETGIPKTNYHGLLATPNGTLFAATDMGAYILPKDKTSWQEYNGGLRSIPSLSLSMDDQGFVYLGSASSGVYKSTSTFGTTQSVATNSSVTSLVATLYPNPATTHAAITIESTKRNLIHIELCDLLGRVLYEVANDTFDKGIHNFSVTSSQLAEGTYFVRITSDSEVKTIPFTVVK